MDKTVKCNKGISIIEILIALVIVAIALVTIAGIFPRMGAHGKAVQEADQARLLAAQVLEGLQRLTDVVAVGVNPVVTAVDTVGTCEVMVSGTPHKRRCRNICEAGFQTDSLFIKFQNEWGKWGTDKVKNIGGVNYTVKWRPTTLPTGCNTANNPTTTIRVEWTKPGQRGTRHVEVTGVLMVRN